MMKRYKKIFLTYHNLSQADFIECAVCTSEAVDIHHISGRPMGNKSDRYDVVENLIPLCRDCHDKAENEKITKQECKEYLFLWSKKIKSFLDYKAIINFR